MKKSNVFKIGVALIALLVVIGGYFAINSFMGGQSGSKTIIVTIKDDSVNKVLVDKKNYKTDAETLGAFLDQYKEEFQVEMETSDFGRFITGLKGIKTTDMKNGPWWMYAHRSPSQNLNRKVGDAPGADALGLFDKDEVEFVFTNKFGE